MTTFHRYIADGQLISLNTQTLERQTLARKNEKCAVYLLPTPYLPLDFCKKHGLLNDQDRFELERVLDPGTMQVRPKFAGVLEIVPGEVLKGTGRTVVKSVVSLAGWQYTGQEMVTEVTEQ